MSRKVLKEKQGPVWAPSFRAHGQSYIERLVSSERLESYCLRGDGGRGSSELKDGRSGVSLGSVAMRGTAYVTSKMSFKANVL